MKKLSKVLSLVLVIAMVFSLCVIGASAKSFTDTDKVTDTYKEAVDVVSDLGIIQGMTPTNFDGQGTLTRAQACALIARMTLGVTTADNMTVSGVKFTDVPATFWGYKYVQYCANAGIVSGVGANKFDPNATLTGYQFAKMLMAALGVDVSTCVGANWAITTAQLFYKLGFSDVVITNDPLAREAASQMVYDAMFYAADAKTGYAVYKNGTAIAYYGTINEASAQAALFDSLDSTDAVYTFSKTAITIEAGTTLAKTVFGVQFGSGVDSFGRDANTYTAKSTALATAYGWNTVTKTKTVAQAPIYKSVTGFDMSKAAFQKAYSISTDTAVYYNGVLQTDKGVTINGGTTLAADFAAKDAGELCNNGTYVEMFGKQNDAGVYVISKVVVYEYNFTVVSKVSTSKATAGDMTLKVYFAESTASPKYFTKTVDASDTDNLVNAANYAALKGYAEGTVLLTCWKGGSGDQLIGAYEPTAVTGTVTGIYYPATVTAANVATRYFQLDNGKTYKLANIRQNAVKPAVAEKGTFYLDENGYFVAEDTTAAVYTNYAFVMNTQIKKASTDLFTGSAAAAVAQIRTTDGKTSVANLATTTAANGTTTVNTLPVETSEQPTINENASTTDDQGSMPVNHWYAYNVDANGNYTFQVVNAAYAKEGTLTIGTSGKTAYESDMYFTADTKLVTYNTTTKTTTTYTGYTNFPANTYTQVLYTYAKNSVVADTIYATVTSAATVSSYAYVTAQGVTTSVNGTAGTYYTVYVNGTETTVFAPSSITLAVGSVYKNTQITDAKVVTAAGTELFKVSVNATTGEVTVKNASNSAVAGREVAVIQSAYFVVTDGTNSVAYTYPTTGAVVYSINGTEMTAATLATKDVVVVSYTSTTADLVLVIG